MNVHSGHSRTFRQITFPILWTSTASASPISRSRPMTKASPRIWISTSCSTIAKRKKTRRSHFPKIATTHTSSFSGPARGSSTSRTTLRYSSTNQICQMEIDISKETILLSHSNQIISFCFDKEVLYILDDGQNVIRYEHKNGRLISENLSKLPNYPDIAKDYKPFDMGYSYTMHAGHGVVGIISDLGLFVLEIL